jgi:PASTA domain
MTERSKAVNLTVAVSAAVLTLMTGAVLSPDRADALSQPPSDVLVLQVEWDQEEVGPGVISEGVDSVFPPSAFTRASERASDWLETASYEFFDGWNPRFGGTVKIAAPRLPAGNGGHEQACNSRFFEDITARADDAALEAGLSLGSPTIYYYDEKLCKEMPDGGAEAAFVGPDKVVMQISRATGPSALELIHAIGHTMHLKDADSLLCTKDGARVSLSDECTVEPGGDPYDVMGEGAGAFSAGAFSALGWLNDPEHKSVSVFNDGLRRTIGLGALADGNSGEAFPTRAIRVNDSGTNFWVEYRESAGVDEAIEPGFAQGATGLVIHREVPAPDGGAPSFQLIDLSPGSPRSNPSLRLPGQTWENPVGTMKVTLSTIVSGGIAVTVGPKAGVTPPRPTGPTALVLQVGWAGQATGPIKATAPFVDAGRFVNASDMASAFLREVSVGRKHWQTTYAGNYTIPTPGPQFGAPSVCTAQTFADINSGAEAALKARGYVPADYDHIVYAHNGAVCQSMPDSRGTAFPAERRVVVQVGEGNFGSQRAGSQTLVEAVGHQLGFAHATALRCVDEETGAPVIHSTSCYRERDPYDVMGSGGGSFSGGALDHAGWLINDGGVDELIEIPIDIPIGTSRAETIAPLTAGRGRVAPFDHRAIRLPQPGADLWIEFRHGIGVDAPERTGDSTVLGLLIRRGTSELLDMSPSTSSSDVSLAVGQTWANELGYWRIRLDGASPDGASMTITRSTPVPTPPKPVFPDPLPHPVPPANPDPVRSMLVLNVGWNGVNEGSTAPLDSALLDQTSFLVNGPANRWYRQSAPSGLFPRNWEAFSGGSFMIPQPKRVSVQPGTPLTPEASDLTKCKPGDEAAEFAQQVRISAKAAAEERGIDPDRFGLVMVTMPRIFCGTSGLLTPSRFPENGEEGGEILIAGPLTNGDMGTILHELGHRLGLNHAQSLFCWNNARQQVPLSNDCKSEEYGDPFDAMGSSANLAAYNPSYANALGWMRNQFHSLEAGDYAKTFHLVPYSSSEQPIEGHVRALRLTDGPTKLWMEWRVPVGPDANITGSGLLIRREVTGDRGWPLTQLLDMTPATPVRESALPEGQTWVNPLGTMRITVNGGDANGAIVTISKANRTVVVPNLEGDDLNQVKARLGDVGLTYGGTSALVDDCTGTLFGRVVDSNPPAGFRVAAGTQVTVRIGQRPLRPGDCQ